MEFGHHVADALSEGHAADLRDPSITHRIQVAHLDGIELQVHMDFVPTCAIGTFEIRAQRSGSAVQWPAFFR